MRASVLQVLALAATALAQTCGFDAFSSPPDQSTYKIGDTLPNAWTPSAPAGKITLTLIGGPAKNLLAPHHSHRRYINDPFSSKTTN
jgi:hypothetical protein